MSKPQRLWRSSSFRLALCFSALLLSMLLGIFSAYYVEMVGSVSQRLDDYAMRNSNRLLNAHAQHGEQGLILAIDQLLSDGVDTQDEIVIYQQQDGLVLAGNGMIDLSRVSRTDALQDVSIERESGHLTGRVRILALDAQHFLIVGSDLQPLTDLQHRYLKATGLALGLALMLSMLGATAFRHLMDTRAATIRKAIRQAGRGNLHVRIPETRKSDEFTLLAHDINHMMAQLEQQVQGIRHVSNMVAHNLRTPLSRTLNHVEAAKQAPESLRPVLLEQAQKELEHLHRLFSKMLLLAEVEAGMGRNDFEPVALEQVLQDVLDYYAPLFQDQQAEIHCSLEPPAPFQVRGDSHLLANALSNLLDNFLKYGLSTPTRRLDITLRTNRTQVLLLLRDHGAGMAPEMHQRVGEHFTRDPQHHGLPGHGLGLASVKAVIRLHQGHIEWLPAHPGLLTRIVLPAAPAN